MRVIRSDEELEHDIPRQVIRSGAIFLVGPTPRDENTPSWRPEAIDILSHLGFGGVVYVPERDSWQCDYLDQVEWEHQALDISAMCGCIAAWVPRDLKTMPAFTTNVEFGRYVDCGGFAYGRPDGAPKTRYLDWLYQEATGCRAVNSLEALMKRAIKVVRAQPAIPPDVVV